MYEIKITKITEQVRTFCGDYNRDLDGKGTSGYEPSYEKGVTDTQEVYKQQVEKLDLVAVINAVNSGGNKMEAKQ